MNIEKTGGPAFPFLREHLTDATAGLGSIGMTKREYFAARAPTIPASFEKLRGYKPVAAPCGTGFRVDQQLVLEDGASHAARWAYAYADAMLALGMKP